MVPLELRVVIEPISEGLDSVRLVSDDVNEDLALVGYLGDEKNPMCRDAVSILLARLYHVADALNYSGGYRVIFRNRPLDPANLQGETLGYDQQNKLRTKESGIPELK